MTGQTISRRARPWHPLGRQQSLILLSGLAALLTLGVFVAAAPLSMMVLSMAGGAIVLLVLVQPVAGLCLMALLLPFSQVWQVTLAGAHVGVAEALLALTLTAWLLRMATRRTIRLPHPALLLPFLVFLAAQSLSLLASRSIRQSIPELLKWLEMLVLYLFMVSELRRQHIPWLVAATLVAGSAQALLGAYQFVRQIGPEPFVLMGRFMRAYGSFRQPNPYAGYLGLVVPLAFSLMLWSAGGGWEALRKGSRRLPPRMLWRSLVAVCLAGATVLLAAGIGLSWSRGAWLGLATSVVVVSGLRSLRAARVILLLLAMAVLILSVAGPDVLSGPLTGRLVGIAEYIQYASDPDLANVEVTDANFAVLERVAHWQAAWAMFRDHPWLGVGIGNYGLLYPSYALPRWSISLGHAHNVFLHILAETGLLGLCAYAIWSIAAAVQAWRVHSRTRGYAKAIAVGVLGIVAHLTIHNLVDNLYVQGTYLHVAMVLGLLPALLTQEGLTR